MSEEADRAIKCVEESQFHDVHDCENIMVSEIKSLRAQLAAANEAKEKAKKELADNKKYLEGVMSCHQANGRDTLRFINQAREAEAKVKKLEAAEQKTAELAAEVERKDKALTDHAMAHNEIGIVLERIGFDRTINQAVEFALGRLDSLREVRKSALTTASAPAAQVLAERDARIWREAGDFVDTLEDVIGLDRQLVRSISGLLKNQAAALSSKSAIGPEEGGKRG